MPQRKRNDRRVIRMVDKVPCPRSDQMTQSDKEYLWEAMKTAYQYIKQLELPLIREHPAHVFCIYCQSFVDDLGPKCFSHDDIEGRVKIDLMGTFNWKTAERVEAEDVRTMTKYLKEQGKYWKTEIENHRDPSPSPSSTPSTSPEPPRKNPKNVRMARRTGVPVVVEQREVVEEPVEMEQREEEIGTRKRKSRAFLESSEEDSTGSEEQETSGSGSKESERSERSEDRVATRLRSLRSHQSGTTGKFEKRAKRAEESDGDDGVPVKKTTKKTGKSVETAEEWGEDSDGEPQPKRRGRPRKSDLVGKEKTPKKGRTAVEESEQGSEESEESEEDGIDRVAEDLRRRGITFHNTRQYSPTRIPKTPQPAEPGEYDDFTEYNLVVNRKQLRKAATIGMEIRKIDKKKDSPKELYGSRQYFWRKAQHFEVAQLAPGPSGADISQMDTPSEQETDSDDEEENRRKMKKKRKKSSESASGGKKTKESKKSDTNKEKAVHIVQDDDDDDIQILETPQPPPPAPKPKDPIRAPTVNWNYKPGSSSSSMDRPRVDRFPTSPSRDHNYDFANISTFSSRTTLSATGTPSKQDDGSAGKKSLLRRSDPIPKIPPAPVVFNFNPSKTPLKTTKSPPKLTETPVITNPVITVNRHIFQDNEIQVPRHVYPSISISNEVVMEDALDSSPTPTTVDPAVLVDSQEVRDPEVAVIDSDAVINVISGSKKTLGQKTFDWNQHLKNVQHDHAYCSTTLTPIHPPPNHNSLQNTNGFRSIFAEFNLPDKTPGDEAKTFDSSATPASQSILNGSQTSSIKFMDMEEDKPSDSGNTLSLPVPTPSPSSSAHGSRISTESVRKQTSGAEKDKSPAQKASTSDYFEEKCEGGLDNMFPLPPGKTKHDEKCTTM